jgi:DNA polymerase II small subunit
MKREITLALNYALNRGFQIHPGALEILERINVEDIEKIIKDLIKEKGRKKLFLINQNDVETALGISEDANIESELKILFDPTTKITTAEGVEGYNALFASRYAKMKRIISAHPEAKAVKDISLVKTMKDEDEAVYVHGLVSEKSSEKNITKLVLEDPTGLIDVIVFDKDMQGVADSLLIDQFVMAKISRAKGGSYIVNELTSPGVPDHPQNRSETEAFAVFLSDLHIGSKFCMEEELEYFIAWLSSPDLIAKKVRFVVIGGDIIDGVGIYRNQDKELVCKTIEEQLERTVEILSKIPSHIKVIIAPGNHDPGRRALPQPAIPKEYNAKLWEIENFHMVGNPALISLNGVKVMIFHGQSIDDIVKTTPGLSYDKPIEVMKKLMDARHLSPTYGGQTPIAPEIEDFLAIEEVPDIFHTGHVHITGTGKHRGILLINSGAWQRQTAFQTSVGVVPTPGFAIIVNLKNMELRKYHDQ